LASGNNGKRAVWSVKAAGAKGKTAGLRTKKGPRRKKGNGKKKGEKNLCLGRKWVGGGGKVGFRHWDGKDGVSWGGGTGCLYVQRLAINRFDGKSWEKGKGA